MSALEEATGSAFLIEKCPEAGMQSGAGSLHVQVLLAQCTGVDSLLGSSSYRSAQTSFPKEEVRSWPSMLGSPSWVSGLKQSSLWSEVVSVWCCGSRDTALEGWASWALSL